MRMVKRVLEFIFFLGIFLLGAGLFYTSLNRLKTVYQSQYWPETSGTVISSEICHQKSLKSESYTAKIVYRYAVDGQDHEGRVITYGFGGDGSKREATEKVAQYPAGAQVKVFYNPSSPVESCLETGGPAAGFAFPIAFGVLLMSAAIWLINRERKKKKRLYRPFLN